MIRKLLASLLFIGATTLSAMAGVKEVPLHMGQSFRYDDFQVHVERLEWRDAHDGTGKGEFVAVLDMTCLRKSDPPGAPIVDVRIEYKDGTDSDVGPTIGRPPDKVDDVDASLEPFEKGQEGLVAFVSTEVTKPTPANPVTITFITGDNTDVIHYVLKNAPISIK